MRIQTLLVVGLLFTYLFGADQVDEMDALKRWIKDKRLVTIKEIGGDLSLSGEIRVEYQNTHEKKDGVDQRAPKGVYNSPTHGYDVEVNLMLDYRTDRLWGSIKLEFDNAMGSVDGTANSICLEKAYFGGRIIDCPTYSLDAEIGRRFLGSVFTSKVQFASRFDGVLFRFNKELEKLGNFYTNLAVFLISDKKDKISEAIEVGLLDLGHSGLQLQYSFINWLKHPFHSHKNDMSHNFQVSQFTVAKVFNPPYFKTFIKPYFAALINTAAQRNETTGNKKARTAYYAGVSIGKVKKRGDFAFDGNYQYVKAQAIPEFDAAGIGLGNSCKCKFYDTKNPKEALGKTNYHGIRLEFLYALADNITLFQSFHIARPLNKKIGPNMHFKQYEVEMIYAF